MTVDILFSGSSGNCTLIRGRRASILVDCGKSCRTVVGAINGVGASPDGVDAIFITHEHSDHTSALETFCKKYKVPVHATTPSAARLLRMEGAAPCVVCHPLEYTERVGDLTVTSFPLPHDSAAHVGYVIEDEEGDSVGIATDMGHVTDLALERLSRCRRVIIEANHDLEMLRDGRYPYYLKQRILSPRGHLSNDSCAELALSLAASGVESFALAHLSAENNDPSLAYTVIRSALDGEGFAECELVVADREFAIRLPRGEKEEAHVC